MCVGYRRETSSALMLAQMIDNWQGCASFEDYRWDKCCCPIYLPECVDEMSFGASGGERGFADGKQSRDCPSDLSSSTAAARASTVSIVSR